jgi:hypothetical protein
MIEAFAIAGQPPDEMFGSQSHPVEAEKSL